MQREYWLKKTDTKCLQALAALLMVCHHLLAMPERLIQECIPLLGQGNWQIEVGIGTFAKICVGLYAFITGYGLAVFSGRFCNGSKQERWKQDIDKSRKSIWKFYKKFWFVFLLFIPYGLWKGIYNFEQEEFLKNLLGLWSTYNHEWWYVWFYLKLLILFPLFDAFVQNLNSRKMFFRKAMTLLLLFGILFGLCQWNGTLKRIIWKVYCVLDFSVYYIIAITGYLMAKFDVYNRKIFSSKALKNRIVNLLGLCVLIFARITMAENAWWNTGDFVFVPLFIYFVINVLGTKQKEFLAGIGNYSIYIWLTHTFLLYYYWPRLILWPKYTVLILIWYEIVSVAIGALLHKVFIFSGSYARKTL